MWGRGLLDKVRADCGTLFARLVLGREGRVGGEAKNMASQRWCLCLVQLDKKATLPCVNFICVIELCIVCKQDCYCSFDTVMAVELTSRLEKTLAE